MLLSNRYVKYLNGNYIVSTDKTGAFLSKRCLRYDEELISKFPDSIDLKITNKCSWGCPYCHENSTPEGSSFDIDRTVRILDQLPHAPIEIAIGGGNILSVKKEAKDLIIWMKERGLRPRITINSRDIIYREEELSDLIHLVDVYGVSIENLDLMNKIRNSTFYPGFKTIVFHVIAGIIPPQDLLKLATEEPSSILILGYKQWGRALNTKIPDLEETKRVVKIIMENMASYRCLALGFDNLALEQLGIESLVPKSLWKNIYLGEEGSHSMYIDAVEEKYAITSRSPERTSWNDIKLLDYYDKINNRGKI